MHTKSFEDAINSFQNKTEQMNRAGDLISGRLTVASINIKTAVNELHDDYVKNNAFVTKCLLDIIELDTGYKELIAKSAEIIQDWETLSDTTSTPAGKYNAEIQKQELRNAGTKTIGLLWNLINSVDIIIKKQNEAVMLLMNESDYLKKVVELISLEGLKKTMVELYKENLKEANPEVKEWIRNLAKPMPIYDLDERKIEEEIPEPTPITVKPKVLDPEEENRKISINVDEDEKMDVDSNEIQIMEILNKLWNEDNDYSLSIQEIREKVPEIINTQVLWKYLSSLVEQGKIKTKGATRNRRYCCPTRSKW